MGFPCAIISFVESNEVKYFSQPLDEIDLKNYLVKYSCFLFGFCVEIYQYDYNAASVI